MPPSDSPPPDYPYEIQDVDLEDRPEDEEGEEGDAERTAQRLLDSWEDADEMDEDETDDADYEEPVAITPRQFQLLLQGHAPFRRILNHLGRGNVDSDGNESPFNLRPRVPTRSRLFPTVPSEAGRTLMRSGLHGCEDTHTDIRSQRTSSTNKRLLYRSLGLSGRGHNRRANHLIGQSMLPTSPRSHKIIHYGSRAYSGQFSDDGNFFFSCTQNFKVRLYDTSNPWHWWHYKTVDYPFGSWTITDASLSPDNKYLAFSSIRNAVCLARTERGDTSEPTILNFAPPNLPRHFGIWSIRFSGDGREIVAGTSNNSVIVYDIERQTPVLTLTNHRDDVNAVCFADTAAPHIVYSGSDDATLRVWDRRSMDQRREAGVFVGHTEGLTFIDSKGDGRYVLSNSKDQSMKLWDLRRMVDPKDFRGNNIGDYSSGFDYRVQRWDASRYRPNPADCSVCEFRGHSVHKTLIRCHFSPRGSSNARYVYSGSEDGRVVIWDLDGTVKSQIDVRDATYKQRPQAMRVRRTRGYEWETCVRDASWHPHAPLLAAVAWNGWDAGNGSVSLHSWEGQWYDEEKDDEVPDMREWMGPNQGINVDARLERMRGA